MWLWEDFRENVLKETMYIKRETRDLNQQVKRINLTLSL